MPTRKDSIPGKSLCRQCKKPIYFNSIGELRSHQWAKHSEMYAKLRGNAKKNLKRGNPGTLISSMTHEQREAMKYKCKHCGKVTKGHSAMIRHSWIHIKERRLAAIAAGKSKELIVAPAPEQPTIRQVRNGHAVEAQPVLNSEMTAVELLNKLYQQRDFVNNVTKLIEGMLTTK
jgi:hypothetical protein